MYTVRKGDTLSGIAKRFAVTLPNILAANPQIKDPSLIHVGDAIRIPAAYLPTLGSSGTSPVDINNRGQIVGSSGTPSGTAHAVLIDGGRITDLGTLGGEWSGAHAVNDLGQVVGWSDTAAFVDHAFLWQDGVMTDLGGSWGWLDINNRGQIVTGQDYIWQDGVKTKLGTLGAQGTYARAINEHGLVVGEYATKSGDEHAFIWQDGTMTDLGTLGGLSGVAYAVNDRGQVVGVSTTKYGDAHAFIWQDGVMKDLGTLGGKHSHAYAVNERGQVVGSSEIKSGDTHAFIWQDGVMKDLGTLGGTVELSAGARLSTTLDRWSDGAIPSPGTSTPSSGRTGS